MVEPLVWTAAERDGFVGDVQAMRRRVVDHIPAQEAERQLKLGSGGLRDVEFAVQLLQLVHGRADASLRAAATLSALAAADRAAATSGARTARRCTRPTRSCARSSTGSSCTSCGAPTSCPTTSASLRRLGRSLGFYSRSRSSSSTSSGATTAARCAGCTRSSSTARCSRAVAQLPGDEAPAVARGGRGAARGARLRRPEGRAAPPRGADERGLAHRRHPAHAAAGDARVVRRRARPRRRAVRLPPDQRGAGPHAVVPHDAARRGRGRPAAGPRARPPRATPPTCSSASRRA